MKRYLLILLITLVLNEGLKSQNVGISNTGAAPAASAMLDIVATDKGFLVPRVALTAINAAGPITAPATALLVYNTATAGVAPNNVVPGYYYWDGIKWVAFGGSGGKDWSLSGNAGTVPSSSAYGVAANNNFIGTTDNTSFVFVCNNLERMRINPADGEVVIGAQTSGLPGDLLCAVSSAANPWATNGYSNQNGSGVFGQITGGTTLFGAVQGEYLGTNAQGAGVRGSYIANTAGTNFGAVAAGVNGSGTSNGAYKFGVYGTGGNTTRSGGVMGYDYGVNGALGYYAANGVDYAVYGFGQAHTNGLATGKLTAGATAVFDQPNATIGLGIYGGVMGGWVKGLVYGTNFSGQKYGVYVHGNTITNDKFVQLNSSSSSDVRIASYATTALTNELTSKGKINLVNGSATVNFDSKLIDLCDLNSLVITATPMGNCNGVYIDNISKKGFSIKEINDGSHNVSVSFIISGTLKQSTEFTEAEILNKQYESNMNGVMHNDNDPNTNGTPIWFDGVNVRHDAVDEEVTGRRALKEAQDKENEKLRRPTAKKNEEK